MSNHFFLPDDDDDDDVSSPATPLRDQGGFGGARDSLFSFDGIEHPSTTPAGPPPSSAASFTPAGAPTASYLGSSIRPGAQAPGTATSTASVASRKIFGGQSSRGLGSKSPLGRSIQGGSRSRFTGTGSVSAGRQPSRLSQVFADDEDEDESAEDEVEADDQDAEGDNDDFHVSISKAATRSSRPFTLPEEVDDLQGGDPWLDLAKAAASPHGRGSAGPWFSGEDVDADGETDMGDITDMLLLGTPAVDERIRKEAEDIFRASVAHGTGQPRRDYQYASIAKSICTQMGSAKLVEAPELIRQTEVQIARLYNDGVGTEDDAERLDETLARTSAQLVSLWQTYAEGEPPQSDEEYVAGIGPGPDASAFGNATYVATLALYIHHTRSSSDDISNRPDGSEPLTETMFRWMAEHHNLYPSQVQEVLRHKPSPASHGMFWQTVFVCLLQGRVDDAIELLHSGGWESVRRAGIPAYTGRALANVQRAVQEAIGMLENCPGRYNNWEIWNSEWTLFRIRTKGTLDQLRRFAEGRGATSLGSSGFGDEDADGDLDFVDSFGSGRRSITGKARKAESQVPWDVYENINLIFDIALGSKDRILAISQDWCEATVGLFGWWDEAKAGRPNYIDNNMSFRQSKALAISTQKRDGEFGATFDIYLERLTRAFRATVDSGLQVNSNSPVEVALASVFEDNSAGLVGILRSWSLPVAASVAEIASLGGWLPLQQTSSLAAALGDLDMDDLEVLGMASMGPDETDGLKDNTLIQYAQALVNNKDLSTSQDDDVVEEDEIESSPTRMDGWELAVHVLGRMNSSERSEETIGELVRTVLQTLDIDAGATIDKIWRLLSDLGMLSFAEEAAEHYGDLLAQESHRYGESVWYYSLAHRPAKVREVMNLLISYSLIQSTAFPSDVELDDHLRRLLTERRSTLELLARRDLDAAELLGRMLSGYATLRQFYELRDNESVPLAQRRLSAVAALTAVISSADDNIRGGLYDETRDAVVSEDFLLVLLGEALVFTDPSKTWDATASTVPTVSGLATGPPVVTGDTLDVLLKAVEDLNGLVGTRVYTACDDFFQVVVASAPGLKGSRPADLLRKSTSNLSGGTSGSSSFMLTGSSMLASQLHRSLSGARAGATPNSGSMVRRGWDWRSGLTSQTTAADVLQRVRHGLSQAMARLWVAEADSVPLPALLAA